MIFSNQKCWEIFPLPEMCPAVAQFFAMSIPIGSMYGIYANIWGILMVNVTIYSSTMDPMGICLYQYVATKTDDFTPLKRMNATRISTIAVGFQAPISGARKHAWPSRRLRRQLVGIFCRFVRKKNRFFWERTKSHG